METILQNKREGLYMETVEVIIFLYGFALDVFYLLWLNAIDKMQVWRASLWGTILGAVTLFATVDVVHNPLQSIPYLAGMFVGSVVGMSIKKRNKK